MNIDTALAQARRELAGSDSPALDAELLLAEVLGLNRAALVARGEQTLEAAELQRYRSLLAQRSADVPVAYLLGRRDFWTLRLRVNPAVLVPRPETELLVEWALELPLPARALVADLGTGSGAVALSLARERPEWRVVATDLSTAALEVASANARDLGLHGVEFLPGDWFTPLGERRFDLLVSNPPYVAVGDPALQVGGLTHEPRLALASGPEGLDDLREIISGAPRQLLPGGWLLLEHGATHGPAVRHALESAGMAHVRSRSDLAGKERATQAQRS